MDDEPDVARPFPLLRIDIRGSEGFDTSEVVQVPRLADGEGAVRILLGFVNTDASGLAHSDYNDTGLLGLGASGFGRRRRSRVCAILCNSKMCNVGFEDWKAKGVVRLADEQLFMIEE